jgi:hypothetical protein
MVLWAMGWTALVENDEGYDKSACTRTELQDFFGRTFYPLTLPLTVGRAAARHSLRKGPLSVKR